MSTHPPIIVEQTYNADLQAVWNAITEIDEMRQWYFENIPDFKAEVGFQTKFNVRTPEREFMHLWEVTEVIPQKKISYSWKYEAYQGAGAVTFELFEEDGQTRLKLTNIGIESFPQDLPEFKRESGVAGWKYFIQGRLKDYLASSTN